MRSRAGRRLLVLTAQQSFLDCFALQRGNKMSAGHQGSLACSVPRVRHKYCDISAH